MGTIVARKQQDGSTRYRAQIRLKQGGKIVHNESRTFSKQALAKAWIAKREAELARPGGLEAVRHESVTIGDLVSRYREEVVEPGDFGRTKRGHLKQLEGMDIARLPAVGLTSADLVEHVRRRRAAGAGASTVNNDLVWLGVVFKYARSAWSIPVDLQVLEDARVACRAARQIGRPKRRTRRPAPNELRMLDEYFSRPRARPDARRPPMRHVMWFALYSTRRLEELTTIQREDFDRDSRTYVVPDVKHPDGSAGNDKVALLPPRGWEVLEVILRDFPGETGPLFPFNHRTISAAFTDACKILGIEDLHFHDLRHEGASRLAEDGATVPELQQVTLHESWGSLQIYVNLRGKRMERVDFEDKAPGEGLPKARTRAAVRKAAKVGA